jgi:hypothetical protein
MALVAMRGQNRLDVANEVDRRLRGDGFVGMDDLDHRLAECQ